ncbi:MAG: ABC transporter permease [Solirubrobacterales bacterium]
MSLGRIAAIARQDLRVLRTDAMPAVTLVIMPLLLMPFLKPAFSVALHIEGLKGASGAEQVVPGMAVTFGFFLVGDVGLGFFREHAWRTWDRLRASPAGTGDILIGKMATPLLLAGSQFGLLFGVGGLLMGLHVKGSWLSLCAVGAAFGLFLVTTGLAVAALCRTAQQATAIVTVGALLLAGLAGALVPYSLLPSWAQEVSPVVPGYWAMQGYKQAILGEGATVIEPVLFLLGFSALSLLIAATRFRVDDTKVGVA